MKNLFNKSDDPQAKVVLERLRRHGHRLTRSRRAVVRSLANSAGWLRPEMIHERAQRHAPKIGLVTVYRTLQLLTELGIVRRIHSDDGCHGYVLARHSHGHHLVCQQCQHIVEFPGTENLHPLVEQLEKSSGYIIQDHMLELTGLCPECQG